MDIKTKKKLALSFILQMGIGVVVIFLGFYFLVNIQTREMEKRIFDKAQLFSLILGANLDKIVGDNLRAYRELQEATYLVRKTKKEVEELRIISPELIIISSSTPEKIWQPLEKEYIYTVKEVINKETSLSLIKSTPYKEWVIHFLPLFKGSPRKLIGVLEVIVRFLTQQPQSIHSLRINKSAYFRKEAEELSRDLARMLRKFLIEAERNLSYLQHLINNMLSDEDIQDIKIFLKDLNILIGSGTKRGVKFISQVSNPLFEEVMAKGKTLFSEVKERKGVREVVSPLYFTKDKKKVIAGTVSLIFSLDRINTLISQRRNNILFLAISIISFFCLIIFSFFKRKILTPITELILLTEKVAKGDFSQESDIRSSYEFETLSISFNKMIKELREYKEKIEDWNVRLREKVMQITKELEEKQARLLESEKLASLGVLSSGIAHQINNPLGVILGHTQMLLKKLREKGKMFDLEETTKLLEIVEKNIKRCSQIVNSLLHFGRKKELKLQSTDIREVIERALIFVSSQLSQKDIEIVRDIKANIPKILADPVQLEQVFVNVILNAGQSIKEKGKIKIEVKLENLEGRDYLFVGIEDNGQGISEENLKRIFDPFFSTKEESGGCGLGLSVSYGIVKAHGGDIEVKSKLGEGTIVLIKLPVRS